MSWKEASVVYNRLKDPGRGREPDGRRLIVGWALGKLERFSERAGSLNFPISKTVGSVSDSVRIVHQQSYRGALDVRSAAGVDSFMLGCKVCKARLRSFWEGQNPFSNKGSRGRWFGRLLLEPCSG